MVALKITGDAFLETVGLAHIKNLVLLIKVAVDPWQGRQGVDLFKQSVRKTPLFGLGLRWGLRWGLRFGLMLGLPVSLIWCHQVAHWCLGEGRERR